MSKFPPLSQDAATPWTQVLVVRDHRADPFLYRRGDEGSVIGRKKGYAKVRLNRGFKKDFYVPLGALTLFSEAAQAEVLRERGPIPEPAVLDGSERTREFLADLRGRMTGTAEDVARLEDLVGRLPDGFYRTELLTQIIQWRLGPMKTPEQLRAAQGF